MSERTIYTELLLDEKIATQHSETNGIDDLPPLDYIGREFGWLEQSGIRLGNAFIADCNDESLWARYINYVVAWAFDVAENFDREGESPLPFEVWLQHEMCKEDELRIRNTSADICGLFEDLLDAHDVTIPSEDREGAEGEARLYGSEYSELEDAVTDILSSFAKEIKARPDVAINSESY